MKETILLNYSVYQRKYYICFFFLLLQMMNAGSGNAQVRTATFNAAGTYTFVPPCGVTSITVEAWGAGGGGGYARVASGAAGGGGGGGAYASSVVTVTPGTAYTLVVGAGGIGAVNNGSLAENGANSAFNTNVVVAAGGSAGASSSTNTAAVPGLGGTVAASVGTTRFAGGQGATGIAGTAVNAGGGGGGGGAGTGAAGNFTVATVSVAGATAVAGGGAGGNGVRDLDGGAGNSPGAGGAGAHRISSGNHIGGDGADGKIVITYNSALLSYCQSVPLNQALNDGISRVIFNTIDNSSTTNAGTEYSDYSCALNTNVERGLTYLLSVYINTGGNNTRTQRAWIDWNQDGDFADAGETFNLAALTNIAGGLTTVSIPVPVTATLGATKMRIGSSSSANPNSCDNQNFSGEVEDYKITVLAPVNCTGTPTAGTITISAASGAPGTTFTLTASGYSVGTGITYQWQSGPAAVGPWTNIGGATSVPSQNITATTTPGVTTFYRLLVTCTPSANNAGSNAVSFATSSATNTIPTNLTTTNITCGTNFTLYDNGGAGGNYSSSADGFVYLQNSGNAVITVSGTYDISAAGAGGGDFLIIYNGTGTYTGVHQTWYSSTVPTTNAYQGTSAANGAINFVSAPGQPLTIRFITNNSGVSSGFALNISYSGNCAATAYCVAPNMGISGYRYYFTNVQFAGTLNDVSNTSSFSNNGYEDFTTLPQAVQEAGEGINVKYTINTFRGQVKAWVDWNKNNAFDEPTESVYDPGNILTNSGTFGFTIPIGTSPGNYRLRMRTVNNVDISTASYPAAFQILSPCGRLLNGETEDYHITVIPRCNARISGITGQSKCSNSATTFTLTATGTAGVTGFNWYASSTGGTPLSGASFTAGPPTGTFTTAAINSTTTYWVSALDAGCETPVRIPVIAEVKSIPDISFNPSTPSLCEGSTLSVTGGTSTPESVDLINEGFEGGALGVFSVSTPIATPSAAQMQWQNKTSTYVPTNTTVWRPAISSGFGSNKFVYATSDLASGQLQTRITSPLVNTTLFTSLTLSFKVYYSHYLTDQDDAIDDYFDVLYSTDGTNYFLLPAHSVSGNNFHQDLGDGTDFVTLTYDMSAYIGNPNFRVAFEYIGDWVDGIALDSVKLYGTRPPTSNFTWQELDPVSLAPVLPIDNLYTSLTPLTLYVSGNSASNVFIQPTVAQQAAGNPLPFIASLNLSNGCVIKDTVKVFIDNNVWIGNTNNWHLASNWCGNVIPTINDRVRIPTSPAGGNMPVIFTGNTGLARSLTIEPGASTTVNSGGILQIRRDLNTQAGASFTNNGTLELVGNEASVSQNFPGPGTIAEMNNLTINNTTATPPGGNHVLLNNNIAVRGELKPTAGLLNLGSYDITMRSTNAATSQVSALGATAGFGYGTGRFRVERFIQTPRKWQFLSVPTNTTQTVNQAWQEGQVPGSMVDVGGYGTQISTLYASPTTLGFDFTSTVGHGMKAWDIATQNYLPQPNTTSPVASTRGYMLFVRGNRAQTGLSGSSTTTLRTRGQLFTGTQAAIAVPANQYVSVGNPYASALNMDNIPLTGMVQSFYVWDPKLAGSFGDGGFQTFTKIGANWVPSPGGGSYDVVSGSAVYDSSFIPSGQAFFVRGGAGASSISFDEGDKASDRHNATRVNGQVQYIAAGVYTGNEGSKVQVDGVMIQYDNQFSNNLDLFDVPKIKNPSQNISIKKSQGLFAVEKRRLSNISADTIFLHMESMRARTYTWVISCLNMQKMGRRGWLVDKYSGVQTELNLSSENNQYSFDVINQPGSYATDRFMIVFNQVAPGLVMVTSVSAARQTDKSVAVNWNVKNEFSVREYELQRGEDGIHFSPIASVQSLSQEEDAFYRYEDINPSEGENVYRIKFIKTNGETGFSKLAIVKSLYSDPFVMAYPNPVEIDHINVKLINQPFGQYKWELLNESGQLQTAGKFSINSGVQTLTIPVSGKIITGSYMLNIYFDKRLSYSKKIIIR